MTNYEKACRIAATVIDELVDINFTDEDYNDIVRVVENELDDIDVVDDRNHTGFP